MHSEESRCHKDEKKQVPHPVQRPNGVRNDKLVNGLIACTLLGLLGRLDGNGRGRDTECLCFASIRGMSRIGRRCLRDWSNWEKILPAEASDTSVPVKHHVHSLPLPITSVDKRLERNSRIKFVPTRPARPTAALVTTVCAPRFAWG